MLTEVMTETRISGTKNDRNMKQKNFEKFRGSNQMIFKVPSNPYHSMIL